MSLFRKTADGLIVSVRVIPGASQDMVEGVVTDDAGDSYIKLRVTVRPEKGKANKAVLKLLAKKLDIAPSAMEIVSNEKARNKQILIRGDFELIKSLLDKIK